MTDAQIAELAKRRWGQTDPSFDDVINAHLTHLDDRTRIYRDRWSNIKEIAIGEMLDHYCEHCGNLIPDGRRSYCNASCNSAAWKERQEAA